VSSDAEDFQFRPLTAPRYTQIPDILIDEWAPHLSPAELRVVLYVARRTFGFHKERDAISLSQLCNGITAHDGRRLDYGTGLSRKGVISACASLSAKGLLSISKQRTPDGDNEINIYTLIVRDMGVVTAGNHPSYLTTPPLVTAGNPQETVSKDSTQERVPFERPPALEENQGHWKDAPGWCLNFARDFSTEFGDAANQGSNTTRIWRLWQQSGLPDVQFSPLLYAARTITHEQPFTGKPTGEHDYYGMERQNQMAYYFRVLEDLVSEATGNPHQDHPMHDITRDRLEQIREQSG